MEYTQRDLGLGLLDGFLADAKEQFTFDEAVARTGQSKPAAANLLHRLVRDGLVDRVRRGHYAIRPLGMLGTSAAAEDILLAVGAGFGGIPHRLAYLTALDELDLVSHPSRTVQLATTKPTKSATLSNRPLRIVIEPPAAISVGAVRRGITYVSDLERALLDAAARPELVGGAAVLAEAIVSAANVDPQRLMGYAEQLSWTPALRRIGSIADALDAGGLARKLSLTAPPTSDIDLEPGAGPTVWRDSRWWVRWAKSHEELANVARQ